MVRTAFAALIVLGVLASARASDAFNNFEAKLKKVKTYSIELTLSGPNGKPGNYSYSFTKPNLARIDTPEVLIYLDGTNEITFNKATNEYLVQPQTDKIAKRLFDTDELLAFASFFGLRTPGVIGNSIQDVGGAQFEVAQLGSVAGMGAWVWFDSKTGELASIGTTRNVFTSPTESKKETWTFDVKSTMVSNSGDASTYTFKPPRTAIRHTLADLPADQWLTDIDFACQVALATNRRVYIDFSAKWCGPCNRLHDDVLVTDDFRSASRYFVFVSVDADADPGTMFRYGVRSLPTQMILDPQGRVVDKTVGYGGSKDVFDFLRRNAGG